MLFMTIYSFDPAQKNEIVKRRMESGSGAPEGVKVIGEWISTDGLHGFLLLTETNDARLLMAGAGGWNDLMRLNTTPVIPAEEALAFVKSMK
jgi:hypothetical protein